MHLSAIYVAEIFIVLGINSTQVPKDVLDNILTVVMEMRDLMRQKADEKKSE